MGGRLAGKVVLITGAAGGLGRAMAHLFAAEGARLILTDMGADRLEALKADLAGDGHDRVMVMEQDVTDEARWEEVVDAGVAEFGRLDVLINNAGIGYMADLEETTLAEWKRVHAVNSEGPFLGTRKAIKVMKGTGGGSIVNISSIAGLIGAVNLAAYCSSKGAVRLFTKAAALHCARRGYNIRVNSIHPSFTETPMVRDMITAARNPDKMEAALSTAAPMGRMGRPEEVAYAALYLASDESSFVTGTELAVDGGNTAA
ncbi:MAG: 3-beta hydroxysteroid dehydrogenase [Tistrella sp.]|jgi:NAD(P)-dependent dehydrogenase (short-subunit alcohol dehydrogenase family)|uniref:3-beta hydroxysteroid dehydrogenase n=1 Tax=Tistrella mobilis TaxID=171437 RepID=A0A3B9IG94_9PROT|nr:glucose 1-dehydrogenase [Tistrella sp.]MAD35141.1 3-beta hydroxysteroid dehydrogenase [Tistrella sp.]MBA77000.1 3-beta hydroxysteroid dehydrogenase [Tistrella sp.]HAE46862.1 3-beta hydroxysteroid dehydrogenase [Tistrella mobilis]